MAKVGEGDPRWIVSERQDGANVNSWHWQERDLSKHTHEQLSTAFADLPVDDAEQGDEKTSVKVDEVSEIKGDVTVAQRKGKMMCYFELKMTLKWSGTVTRADGAEDAVKGTMEVPEVDHDEFKNDYDITVRCTESSKAARSVEDIVRSKGRQAVRKVIIEFFEKLFAEYHIGQQLKSGAAMPPPPPTSDSAAKPSGSPASASAPATAAAKKDSASGQDTSFSWKMRWRVPQENLFNCFVDAGAASIYTRSPAVIDAKAGGQFSFLGGVISGYYVDVAGPNSIKMQWRLGSWATGVHSSVVMQFTTEEPGVSLLEFAQSGIPTGQLQSVQQGWKGNFFEALRVVYGFSMDYV